MKPWLEGDFTGVDLRAELQPVRDVLFAAAHRGEDVTALVKGVAEADPIACAELCVGPRAVAHPATVLASLEVLDELEQTVAASGLFARLADLAPTLGDRVLAAAVARHPASAWLVRMSARLDPRPGTVHLRALRGTEWFAPVCAMYARDGVTEGLIALTEEGEIEPVLALYRAGRDWTDALCVLLEHHPSTAIVPWLAAVHGPDLRPLLEPLVDRVPEAARARLREALGRVS